MHIHDNVIVFSVFANICLQLIQPILESGEHNLITTIFFVEGQGSRPRNDLYCVEWDVKLYYTIPYHTMPYHTINYVTFGLCNGKSVYLAGCLSVCV